MAWLLLIVCISVIIWGIITLIRSIYGIGNERTRYWNGPAPKPEERQVSRQHIVEFLQQWPESGLAKDFPDLANQAEIIREYDRLENLYRNEKIDEIDYHIQMEKIIQRVSIDEITGEKPPINPQRFF